MKLSYLFLFLVLGSISDAEQLIITPHSDGVLVNVGDTIKKKTKVKKTVKKVVSNRIEEPRLISVEEIDRLLVDDSDDDSNTVFIQIEVMPEFIGGLDSLNDFIEKNLKYPPIIDIEGRVVARFVVEKDGSISNIEILKKLGFGCDEEVIRLIKLMPKWNPGKTYGKAVRVSYILPIVFKL